MVRNSCGHPGHKVNGCMNGSVELISHVDANKRKLAVLGGCGQKWAWDSNFSEWINLAEFLHANTYLR